MCHINLYATNKKNLNHLSGIINATTALSFARNKDGEGFLTPSNHLKSGSKIIYNNIHTPLLITHQRFSTSGFSENMSHPHIGTKINLVHNGVINGLGDKNKSDTAHYMELLESNLSKLKLVEAINTTHKDLSGSFSVVIQDRKTNKVYYYKNDDTSMYHLKTSSYLFMSTCFENLKLIKENLNLKSEILVTPTNTLFEVVGTNLKEVAKLDILTKYKELDSMRDAYLYPHYSKKYKSYMSKYDMYPFEEPPQTKITEYERYL